jgi:hypothetical protein
MQVVGRPASACEVTLSSPVGGQCAWQLAVFVNLLIRTTRVPCSEGGMGMQQQLHSVISWSVFVAAVSGGMTFCGVSWSSLKSVFPVGCTSSGVSWLGCVGAVTGREVFCGVSWPTLDVCTGFPGADIV